MKVNRNDPCPCGSGKKYKACCMGAVQEAERTGTPVSAAELASVRSAMLDAARSAEVWEVDVAPMNVSVDGGALAPAMGMVVAAGMVVLGKMVPRPGTVAERAKALADLVLAASDATGVVPARVHVREAEVAPALAALLADRGVDVQAAPIPGLESVMDDALEHLAGDPVRARMAVPETWAETGCTPDEVRAFHEAALAFHAAAPWDTLDSVPLVLRFPDGDTWAGSVMGSAGMEYGMALYSDPGDLADLLESMDPDPTQMIAGMRGFTLTLGYDRKEEVGRALRREVAKAGWPVPGPDAYPRLYAIRAPERRVTAAHVRRVTEVLRAVGLTAAGMDPEPTTGIQVDFMDGPEVDLPWRVAETPGLVLAEGPGADPRAALRDQDAASDDVTAVEQARFNRLQEWLATQGLPKSAHKAAVRNGEAWGRFAMFQAISAGAFTEYDLRLFLYRFYPLAAHATQATTRELPRSMDLILRFLETEEGIRYPFAADIVAELHELAGEAKKDAAGLEAVLPDMADHFWDDVTERGLVPDRDLTDAAGGWGEGARALPGLWRELQRRWLLWYDEEVRGGATDHDALYDALVERQRAWEAAPHPDHGGRTPAEMVLDALRSTTEDPERDSD